MVVVARKERRVGSSAGGAEDEPSPESGTDEVFMSAFLNHRAADGHSEHQSLPLDAMQRREKSTVASPNGKCLSTDRTAVAAKKNAQPLFLEHGLSDHGQRGRFPS